EQRRPAPPISFETPRGAPTSAEAPSQQFELEWLCDTVAEYFKDSYWNLALNNECNPKFSVLVTNGRRLYLARLMEA
ncbi:hypothetical protein AVEN_215423-1, partial [Araneus ventricosus]